MGIEKFEDILSAISFAEAGEHEKAREILKGKKVVLLAVSDRMSDRDVFKYTLNISRRIEADIDILHLTDESAENENIREFISDVSKEGIKCSLVKKDGCMKKAILNYTEKRREVVFVVIGSTPELDIECKADEKNLSEAWKRLKCPLVVVSKGEMPSTA